MTPWDRGTMVLWHRGAIAPWFPRTDQFFGIFGIFDNLGFLPYLGVPGVPGPLKSGSGSKNTPGDLSRASDRKIFIDFHGIWFIFIVFRL